MGHCRRRAVGEPLRAGGPPDRETCGPNAGWAGDGQTAVHFPSIPARRRALPPNPCNGANSCKETGEVHGCLQGNGGSARRNGRPAGLLTCTSPKSLHEIAPLQENVRSARMPERNWSKCMAGVQPAAGKRAKCTAGCRKRGEVHASVRARPFPYISPSSLHLEDFMQGYGGNVRRPAAKRGK